MFPKMSCFWALLIVFLSFAIINTPSQSKPLNHHHHHHHHKSHSVVIGTVYSPSCLQLKNLPKPTHYFVTVECWKETGSKWRFRQVVKTDNHGGFRLHLHFPFLFTKCCFTNNDNRPATCTHPRLVASRRDGTRVVSAGLLALECTGGHGKNSKKISQFSNPSEAFLPPILGSFLPPLPQLPPLPSLPRLPPLPGIPFMPPVKRAAKPSENQPEIFPFPPNPFNVPILQAPPLTIPPIFPLPDSPPLFNLPPLPSLIQPPPPPPPALPPPLQLPPFPFQPTPGFPGVPPTRKNYSP